MVIWMKVSDDEYELPEAIADTSTELARKYGLSKCSVMSAICNAKRRGTRCIYVKVEVEAVDED